MKYKSEKVAILFVVERGYLEQQAKLFIASINKYFKRKTHTLETFAFSPRKDFKPDPTTVKFLKSHTTHYFEENLNTDYVDFPLINGHLGARFFEKQFPEYSSLFLIDTDTVFLNDFAFLLEQERESCLMLSPVDNKGVGTNGIDDRDFNFWFDLYTLLGIKKPQTTIMTKVGMEKIWPYYNAGFVYARNIQGFFNQWVSDFNDIFQSNIRSVFSGKNGSKTIFLEQVALAICAQRYHEQIGMLPETINYPIPFHPKLINRTESYTLADLVHIHYHKWFQHPGFLDHVTTEEDKRSEQYRWLKAHLPLQPEIDGPFKC